MANLGVSTDFTPDFYLRDYLNYNDQVRKKLLFIKSNGLFCGSGSVFKLRI